MEFPSSGLYPNLDLELPGSSKDKNQRSANKDTGLLSKKDGEAHVSGVDITTCTISNSSMFFFVRNDFKLLSKPCLHL